MTAEQLEEWMPLFKALKDKQLETLGVEGTGPWTKAITIFFDRPACFYRRKPAPLRAWAAGAFIYWTEQSIPLDTPKQNIKELVEVPSTLREDLYTLSTFVDRASNVMQVKEEEHLAVARLIEGYLNH